MPVASATAERSFSVRRRLKTYVRSTVKNDRLSSLGLLHIHRDFDIDIEKAMEEFVAANLGRWILESFSNLTETSDFEKNVYVKLKTTLVFDMHVFVFSFFLILNNKNKIRHVINDKK